MSIAMPLRRRRRSGWRWVAEATGSRAVDAGIIGGPPRSANSGTRFYTSGTHAAEFMRLNDYGLDVREAGAEIGQASGLKMCYAA